MASYPIDNSAILYLAQRKKDHTNIYRFTITLTEDICPVLLQQAADRVCHRFPTIFAGFRPGLFSYSVIPAKEAPGVQHDPGMLKTMSGAEIEKCAYRIFHSGREIIIEAFHALTDGYGAITSVRTLAAEYLRLRYGLASPEQEVMLEQGEPDWETELHDAYLDHAQTKPMTVPNRYAYQLPGRNRDWNVKTSMEHFSTDALLKAAKTNGVSMTAMLSGIMAEAIMELQQKHRQRKQKPVRIMVPIDLRRQFSGKTLRNFILYALPTMEPEEKHLPRMERLRRFQEQIRNQMAKDHLAAQVSRNVRLQNHPLFRFIPWSLKSAVMQLVYHFCGERNSSITLTNLGPVFLSEELKKYIHRIDVHLTPRRNSPYNCGLISCGDITSISISRFGAEPELEPLFFSKLRTLLEV